MADYLKVQCFAVRVLPSSEIAELPKPTRKAIEQHLELARRNGVTQVFLAKPARLSIPFLNRKHLAMRVVDTLVAERRPAS
ncbi:MAG: hypothetical protein Q8N47_04360 [Bryobacterales bacterium]|nr:hypothetical protein [Bryobacterales bacterium]